MLLSKYEGQVKILGDGVDISGHGKGSFNAEILILTIHRSHSEFIEKRRFIPFTVTLNITQTDCDQKKCFSLKFFKYKFTKSVV